MDTLNPYMVRHMTDDELRKAMHKCFLLLGTPAERDARLMNSQYRDELASRKVKLIFG